MKRLHLAVPFIALFSAACATATQQVATSVSDWPSYNGTLEGTRYSTLTQITPATAPNLERACTFDTGENMSMQSGPVVVGNVLYLTTDTSTYAIDAATCRELWHTVRTYEPIGPAFNPQLNLVFTGAVDWCTRIRLVHPDSMIWPLEPATSRVTVLRLR